MKLRQCNYMIGTPLKHKQCMRFATVKLLSEGVKIMGKWLVTPGTESWLCKQHAKIVLHNKNSWRSESNIDKLFDKDMRWTRIHEMIKMRVPISVDDRDYYLEKLTPHNNY